MASVSGKIIVIVGPTSSGKSSLAVRIAKKFGGEVVSADSRQIYRGLDIASGKVTAREMGGIPHHLLDIADPSRPMSVAQYQRKALAAVRSILRRGRVPVVCGGTGQYVQAIADGIAFPEVKPDAKLRSSLSSKTPEELAGILKELDPRRYAEIDRKNPRRLVRAIEIATHAGSVPPLSRTEPPFDALRIGIEPDPGRLVESIRARTRSRMRRGMIAEAKQLVQSGVSLDRLEDLGLEYRLLAKHLKNEISKNELASSIELEDRRYAKRQMTWFKRDKRIRWFRPEDGGLIEDEVSRFLS